jgi:hypothetical protein
MPENSGLVRFLPNNKKELRMKRIWISLAATSLALLVTQASAGPTSVTCSCDVTYANNTNVLLSYTGGNLVNGSDATACLNQVCLPYFTNGPMLKCNYWDQIKGGLSAKAVFEMGSGCMSPGYPKNPNFLKLTAAAAGQSGTASKVIYGAAAARTASYVWN